MDKKQAKLLARFLSEDCFRNSILEDYHSGIFPSTKDKYKDVVVISPYGEILFNELSRISDEEMRKLMLDAESKLVFLLMRLNQLNHIKIELSDDFIKALNHRYKNGVTWDVKKIKNKMT
jgi:hypothetical protein